MPLITVRWSFHWFPGCPLGGSISFIRSHCLSVNVYFFMLIPPFLSPKVIKVYYKVLHGLKIELHGFRLDTKF